MRPRLLDDLQQVSQVDWLLHVLHVLQLGPLGQALAGPAGDEDIDRFRPAVAQSGGQFHAVHAGQVHIDQGNFGDFIGCLGEGFFGGGGRVDVVAVSL